MSKLPPAKNFRFDAEQIALVADLVEGATRYWFNLHRVTGTFSDPSEILAPNLQCVCRNQQVPQLAEGAKEVIIGLRDEWVQMERFHLKPAQYLAHLWTENGEPSSETEYARLLFELGPDIIEKLTERDSTATALEKINKLNEERAKMEKDASTPDFKKLDEEQDAFAKLIQDLQDGVAEAKKSATEAASSAKTASESSAAVSASVAKLESEFANLKQGLPNTDALNNALERIKTLSTAEEQAAQRQAISSALEKAAEIEKKCNEHLGAISSQSQQAIHAINARLQEILAASKSVSADRAALEKILDDTAGKLKGVSETVSELAENDKKDPFDRSPKMQDLKAKLDELSTSCATLAEDVNKMRQEQTELNNRLSKRWWSGLVSNVSGATARNAGAFILIFAVLAMLFYLGRDAGFLKRNQASNSPTTGVNAPVKNAEDTSKKPADIEAALLRERLADKQDELLIARSEKIAADNELNLRQHILENIARMAVTNRNMMVKFESSVGDNALVVVSQGNVKVPERQLPDMIQEVRYNDQPLLAQARTRWYQ